MDEKRGISNAWWAFTAILVLGVLGVIVGGIVGAATYQPESDMLDFGRSFNVLAGAFVGGFFGLVAGTAASIARIVWRWSARQRHSQPA